MQCAYRNPAWPGSVARFHATFHAGSSLPKRSGHRSPGCNTFRPFPSGSITNVAPRCGPRTQCGLDPWQSLLLHLSTRSGVFASAFLRHCVATQSEDRPLCRSPSSTWLDCMRMFPIRGVVSADLSTFTMRSLIQRQLGRLHATASSCTPRPALRVPQIPLT